MRLLNLSAGESSLDVKIESDQSEHGSHRLAASFQSLRHIGVNDVLQNEAESAHRVDVKLVIGSVVLSHSTVVLEGLLRP